jgi:hypothetical protein
VTALALPVALILGAVASLVGAGVRRLPLPRRQPIRRTDLWGSVRRLLRGGKNRASLLEAGGALACFLAAGLAGSAVLGSAPGSGALVYLSLLGAAAGAHVAASDPTTDLRSERVGRARVAWALAEPAFVVALGAALLRWRAGDLDAVRGAQEVLGPGLAVGPPIAAVGLWLAAFAFVVAGAVRLVPRSEAVRAGGRRAGSALLIGLCRWAVTGATAMVAAVLVAGGDVATLRPEAILPLAGAAVSAAVVLGAADGLLARFPRRRALVGLAALVISTAAAVLVVSG